MGPWIPQSVTLLSAGQQNLLRCLPAWIFLRFNSHNPHRLRYACYFLQSHAEVPKLALEELIEVLKPLNLKNRIYLMMECHSSTDLSPTTYLKLA